ncbi:MAG TPA: hypothetical protein VFP91_16405 [Vicinamibacterales bacterium]|nr:hypothetical protein [Vicinamibacterales bacterium]
MTTPRTLDDDASDVLVQRFVDQELTAHERVRFVARLGRDEELRRRTIELEELVIEAERLPRPIVPDSFAASVMARLPRPTVWHRLLNAVWMPRTLQWNAAGAMAAACAVLLVAAILGRPMLTTRGRVPVTMTSTESPITPVRLVVMQPGARMVQVAGDFNGWNPAQTSLEQISDGAWAVTISLKPGRYAYMFVVDGRRWVADPFATEQYDDGFGARNAVVEVRPERSL